MDTILSIYTTLFSKKIKSSDEFVDQLIDSNHMFYYAARDIAREVLSKNKNWRWLAYRLDDVAMLAEENVAKKVQKWKFRSLLGCNKMPLCNPQSTIKWLFKRMISEYKNLFDSRSKNYLDIRKSDKILKIIAWEKMQEEVA